MKSKSTIFAILTAVFFTSTLILIYLNYFKPVDIPVELSPLNPTLSQELTPSITPSSFTENTTVPSPAANWKTYRSDTYGFSFQYPASTKIYGNLSSSVFSLSSGSEVVSVTISPNPQNLSPLDFYLSQINSQDPNSLKNYVTSSTITYHNNTFTNIIQDSSYFSQQPGGLNHYLISSKNYIINFNYSDNATVFIDQILSTFKFL